MTEHTTYESIARRELIEARAARQACPDYADVIAEATRRGYRLASLHEQEDVAPGGLYLYRNEVFVKDNNAGVQATGGSDGR